MSSLRDVAADVFVKYKMGIDFIIIYQEGRSWNYSTFRPRENWEQQLEISVDSMNILKSILQKDKCAIIVDGYTSKEVYSKTELTNELKTRYYKGVSKLENWLNYNIVNVYEISYTY